MSIDVDNCVSRVIHALPNVSALPTKMNKLNIGNSGVEYCTKVQSAFPWGLFSPNVI
ncbi:uncharacterized protein PHALS_04803 [Plasmopara halstedii]|uniref:Uncharacterized protein n=1 Tax=Plasmopara halstedii TaxID=4781 RepID=A0A0P1B0Y6_PLAHL|nr:uncharacterized protein PHALS_04803 [Plasmopara halstedii]CEG47655.1 hypothetical protein PHALS_04803 [Plasmopara halstedii]|eukprot:XP_024584024.1 hypothetical protein PHALS_04803 [Plasmopara halstedii]